MATTPPPRLPLPNGDSLTLAVLARGEKKRQLRRSLLFSLQCSFLFAVALHPAAHQLIFGPRVGGASLWYRQWQFRHDHASAGDDASWLRKAAAWLGIRPSRDRLLPWEDLLCAERNLLASSLCSDPDPAIRRAAICSFQSNSVLPVYVAQIAELIDDQDPAVERAAKSCLSRWGTKAASTAPRLRDLLGDSDPERRLHTASALWDVSGDATEALPYLVAGLQDADARLRIAALRVFVDKAERAIVAKQQILGVLHDDDPFVRILAVTCLSYCGRDCLPLVVNAVHDPDAIVRPAALECLARFPDAVDELRPVLHALLRDPNLCSHAENVLYRIDRTYSPAD
jgi:HEAT repeat protein